jgi:hypothetical protein
MGSSVPDDYHQCSQHVVRFHNSEAFTTFPQKTNALTNHSGRVGLAPRNILPAYNYWRSYVSLLP